jgi:hypothetical protein
MNHSLAAIAERIQGRNDALRSELGTLDALQSQLHNANQLLQVEEIAHATTRKSLLLSLQSSHEIELQVLQLKDNIHTIESSISQLHNDTSTFHSKTRDFSHQFDTNHAPIYANHALSTKLYLLQLQSNLDNATSKNQNRANKLKSLHENATRMRHDIESMTSEHTRLIEIQNELDTKEEEDDEEMVALGMQIKSVLAKVRTTLYTIAIVVRPFRELSSWYSTLHHFISSEYLNANNI